MDSVENKQKNSLQEKKDHQSLIKKLQAEHGKVMRAVRKHYSADSKPMRVDKA